MRRRFVLKMPTRFRVCADARLLSIVAPRAKNLGGDPIAGGRLCPAECVWHGSNQRGKYSKCRKRDKSLTFIRFTKEEIEGNMRRVLLKKRAMLEQRQMTEKGKIQDISPGDRPPLPIARPASAAPGSNLGYAEGSPGSAPKLKVKMPPRGYGCGSSPSSAGRPTAMKAPSVPAKAPPNHSQAQRGLMRALMLEDRGTRNHHMENMIGAIRALAEGIRARVDGEADEEQGPS
ncbi:unnamed protein product [Prorocentrum cordatum]|uniref:Uncharacterized protein n=1 Tax=Prorocentrum cordatum TaxID=2364126 RepID=A0ABN9S2S4_9DINO|nr:unnamed protein product [Polarella glacialis]